MAGRRRKNIVVDEYYSTALKCQPSTSKACGDKIVIHGKDGKDGKDGKCGPPGKPGKDGKNGKSGSQGRTGDPGLRGETGEPGCKGRDGTNIYADTGIPTIDILPEYFQIGDIYIQLDTSCVYRLEEKTPKEIKEDKCLVHKHYVKSCECCKTCEDKPDKDNVAWVKIDTWKIQEFDEAKCYSELNTLELFVDDVCAKTGHVVNLNCTTHHVESHYHYNETVDAEDVHRVPSAFNTSESVSSLSHIKASFRVQKQTIFDSRNDPSFDGHVGCGSLASGTDNSAPGVNSVASGRENIASGLNSTSKGTLNTASGPQSFASGTRNVVSGTDSHAHGSLNTVSGVASTATGTGHSVNGSYSLVTGTENTVAGTNSFSAGTLNTVSTDNSGAFGESNTVSGPSSAAIGCSNTNCKKATLAVGTDNTVAHMNSLTLGLGLLSHFDNSTTVGMYNSVPPSDSLFVVGCGEDDLTRANAFEVRKADIELFKDTIIKDLEISEDLCVEGDTHLKGTLKIDGKTTVQDLCGDCIEATTKINTKKLTVTDTSGTTTICGGVIGTETINTTGNITVGDGVCNVVISPTTITMGPTTSLTKDKLNIASGDICSNTINATKATIATACIDNATVATKITACMLCVTGVTELDSLNVSSTSTFKDDVTIDGNLNITGSVSKATGTFKIQHPLNKDKWLYHSFVESNTAGDNIYRYTIRPSDLVPKKDNYVGTIKMPRYFSSINENVQVWVTPVEELALCKGTYNKSVDTVIIEGTTKCSYNVLVIGTRCDRDAVKNWKGTEIAK